MRRAFVVLLATVGMSSVAAPVPKKPAADYFPATLGTKWEYKVEGRELVTYTYKVTKVTEADGVKTVEITTTVQDTDDATVTVNECRVDADGVAMTAAEGKEISPPRLDLRAKPKAEDTWDGGHGWKDMKYGLTTTVGKEEEVEVPAGKFSCLPHVQTFTLGETTFPARTSWYAPGIGLVKRTSEGGVTLVLLKFTPG